MAAEPNLTNAQSRGPGASFDPAAESLSQALRAGFTVLGVIMVVLVVAYLLSGVLRVQAGEQGIIVRLGKLQINRDSSPLAGTPVFGPGWHPSLPEPFDRKIILTGKTETFVIDSFSFRYDDKGGRAWAESVPPVERIEPGEHGSMLSGDRGLSYARWKVEYRIEKGEPFVRNVGETKEAAERLIKRLAEAAITRVVAGLKVDVLTRIQTGASLEDYTFAVRLRLAEQLDELNTGIVVVKLTAETAHSQSVQTAFANATNAANSAEKEKSDALRIESETLSKTAGPVEMHRPLLAAIEAYGAAQARSAPEAELSGMRTEIDRLLDAAQGDVEIRLRRAQAAATEARETLRREYESFHLYRAQYQAAPLLTSVRLWQRMREIVLSNPDLEVFFVPDSDELRILTNRDQERELRRQEEEYRKRMGLTQP